MFEITGGKGFHVTFENGNTVSVQFGSVNYCQNYNPRLNFTDLQKPSPKASEDAEIMVWDCNGNTLQEPVANCTPEQMLQLMLKVAGTRYLWHVELYDAQGVCVNADFVAAPTQDAAIKALAKESFSTFLVQNLGEINYV
jgi:hypothetical protein